MTLHGKRGFANVIKLRISKREIILDYLDGSNVITREARLEGSKSEM